MGLIYTVLGFAVVMIVLLLITFLLYGFSAVLNIGNRKKEKADTKQEEPETVSVPAPVSAAEPAHNTDDTELVAVITAAIAASLNTTSDKLIVRSIRKVSSWKKETLRQKNKGLI